MAAVQLLGALQWLEQTPLAQEVRGGAWTYAALESVHLIGLGCLLGSIAALDLRLIGRSRNLAMSRMARHLLPIAVFGFVLLTITGFLLFTADAVALSANTAFQIKLALILLAGLNALACHRGPLRTVEAWDRHARPPRTAAIMGFCSLVFWIAVIVCGRLIAYV